MTELNYKAIIERIVETSQEKLNDKELEFIASVYERHVEKGWNLSDPQKKWIRDINARVLGRG